MPECYADAVSLLKLSMLLGPYSVRKVPAKHAGDFQSCGFTAQANRILHRALMH